MTENLCENSQNLKGLAVAVMESQKQFMERDAWEGFCYLNLLITQINLFKDLYKFVTDKDMNNRALKICTMFRLNKISSS